MSADTLTLVLATERGTGLEPLTLHRPKAALPVGGAFRIIDFTLANCLHSGLHRVLVLTQYKSHSLHKHLRDGWSIFNPDLGEYITPVPPQQREGPWWYRGPRDAIRQNRYLVERSGASHILVLAGEAIYRMDYAELIRAHRDSGAQVSLAVRGIHEPGSGVQPLVALDESGRVRGLSPFPGAEPAPAGPGAPESAGEPLATMGVYLFDRHWLLAALEAESEAPDLDLGLSLVAPAIATTRVQVYRFGGARGRVTPDHYWCDCHSIDAYYEANMGLLLANPPIDLYQADWSIRTYQGQYPPARTVPGPTSGTEGIFVNSMLAAGTVISGGGVNHSILSPQVQVRDGAIVDSAILFHGAQVGEGANLRNCIIDKYVQVPPKERIGFDRARDQERFAVSPGGIVVVPRDYRFSPP